VPMAGGSLISKIGKAFRELILVGLVEERPVRIFGAQASGCAPISTLVKSGSDDLVPVKPDTVVKSLSIGAPADGLRATRTIRDSGGWADDVSDAETIRAITLLAETEGIFAETAGGVTVAVAEKLLAQGRLDRNAVTVLCITGNGLKTADLLASRAAALPVIEPKYSSYKDSLLTKPEEEPAHVGAV